MNGPDGKPLRYGSRAPLSARIEREQAKLAKLDERIGQLMAARADVEESLAEMYKLRNRMAVE